jgi:tripartite-type tricarboxylate transporter receptor subunit TctC
MMILIALRRFAVVFAAALGVALAPPAAAQSDKPIRMIVGFPAGAAIDTLARMIAEKMRLILNQPVIVENKTGAAGRLATEFAKAQAPDGTTLLMTPLAPMVTNPHSHKGLRYDVFRDFAPVSHVANFQLAFAVGPGVSAGTLREYVELVKKDPKMGNYASAAAGSIPHFLGVMFARTAGVTLTHVPYKGTAPALTDLLGGQIAAVSTTIGDISPLHKAGKIRALAVSGAQRSEVLPEVPTFREQGYDLEGNGWYAVFAPAGTPKETIDRLSRAIAQAVQAPDVRGWILKGGLEPTGTTPEALAEIHKADYAKWGAVIRASGFTAED